MLRPVPRPLVENRVARRVLKTVARRVAGYTGYFSLHAYPVAHLPQFDLTEKRDIYQPGGLDAPSIFDVLRQASIPYAAPRNAPVGWSALREPDALSDLPRALIALIVSAVALRAWRQVRHEARRGTSPKSGAAS